ncbi:hypothetical protein ACHAW5_003480 [Stephanodiscus triporus]|uniref:Transmembrane protein 34 n=1 Tax=Stephanodiscus triporus TaxID=2934178 RepID=A0ABD3MJX2_9STRA
MDSYNEALHSTSSLESSDENAGRWGDASPLRTPPTTAWGTDDMTFIQKYLSRIVTAILAVLLVGLVFVLLPTYAVHAAKESRWDETLYWTAGVFVLVAVPVSAHGIIQHLVNCRSAAFYIRSFRELYEAFVLSSFLYYIFELLGGEEQLALKLRTRDAKYGRHGLISRFFIKGDWQMGRPFMMNCKFGVLQYVLVRIIATIVMVVLQSLGKYHPEDWSWDSPAIYMVILINVSIAYAMYCLVKLYYATKDDLKEWNPLWKFLCIKGIIFFTFWQGFLISILHFFGVLGAIGGWDSEHVSDGLQDFLLIVEMVFFAVAHRYAFPHTDYIHYLQRNTLSTPGKSRRGLDAETLFLFDQDHNAINDPNSVDIEYEPPTVRQLDRPMSVSRALMGVVPNETLSDIARMGISGLMGDGSSGGSQGLSGEGEIVISRDHAEMI